MADDDLFEQGEPAAPPVIGGEYVEDDDTEPPVPAYLPAEPIDPPQEEVTVQLRHADDGTLVMLAFTSIELLTSCLGEQQSWIAVAQEQIESIQRACEAELLVWDPVRPEDEE